MSDVSTSYREAPTRTVIAAGVTYHGGIFQYHHEFASTAIEFLDR